DRRLRRFHRRQVERLLPGGRGHRLEARVAQDHPQRPQDLRLVVADEDAGGGTVAHAGTSWSVDGSGSGSGRPKVTTKLDPWPGSDSTSTSPPFASMKPRAIARPRPEPAPLAAP